jgi:hypothetical protein
VEKYNDWTTAIPKCGHCEALLKKAEKIDELIANKIKNEDEKGGQNGCRHEKGARTFH